MPSGVFSARTKYGEKGTHSGRGCIAGNALEQFPFPKENVPVLIWLEMILRYYSVVG